MAKVKKRSVKHKVKRRSLPSIRSSSRVNFKQDILKSYTFWILIALIAVMVIFSVVKLINPSPSLAPGDGTSNQFVDQVVSVVTGGIDLVTNAGSPLFSALLGDVAQGSDLFVKTLIFLLVVLVTVAVLEQVSFFSARPWMQFGVGGIVSILGIRFIPNDMITAIAFPSSVFVASIAIGLPFLLYGIVLHNSIKNTYLRRVGWTLFATMVVVLWFYNADKPYFYSIYLTFLIFTAIAFLFDGTLQHFLNVSRSQRNVEGVTERQRNRILGEINDLESAYRATTIPSRRVEIERDIASLKIALKRLK